MKIAARVENSFSTDFLERCKNVDPATIGHLLHFGFMGSKIKSLLNNVKVAGPALTVKTTSMDSIMVHKAVSMAKEGDVLVIDRNGDTKHACVGDVVAYAANVKKIAGIIIDGPATDIQGIREIGIPVFATGLSPITTTLVGNSGEINTTIQCGGISVNPGDLVIADDNGVLVINRDLEGLEELIQKSEEKEAREPGIKARLDNGEELANITRANEILREKGLI